MPFVKLYFKPALTAYGEASSVKNLACEEQLAAQKRRELHPSISLLSLLLLVDWTHIIY